MVNGFFAQIFHNHIFGATILTWIIAQTLKVLLGAVREKRFDFRWFLGTGGMPSSHAAGVTALTVGVGLHEGFDSALFALAATFSLVVFFDAQVVRRASGRQARLLNQIMEDIYWRGKVEDVRLRELLGHTPVEVFCGILFGLFLAIIFY